MGEHVCDFSSGCSKKGSVCDFRGAVDSAVGGLGEGQECKTCAWTKDWCGRREK